MFTIILATILVIALLPKSLNNLTQYRQSTIMQKAKRYNREVCYDNVFRNGGQTLDDSMD